MNKQIPNLTNEEKKDILNKYENFLHEVNNLKCVKSILHAVFGGILSTIAIFVGLVLDPLAFRVLLVTFTSCTLFEVLFRFDTTRSFKKTVTKKISYKEFKQLKKTGELAKWQKQINSFEVYDYKSETKKYEMDRIDIYNNQQTKQTTQNINLEK